MDDSQPSTRTVDVDRLNALATTDSVAAQTDGAWSFGPAQERVFIAWGKGEAKRPQPNDERSLTVPDKSPPKFDYVVPRTLKRPRLGKRGFAPLYHWEGVVEYLED